MDEKKLNEIYELVKANNKMLKSMRRTAFLKSVVKILIFIVLPIWLYISYIHPMLQSIVQTLDSVSQTSKQISTIPKEKLDNLIIQLEQLNIDPSIIEKIKSYLSQIKFQR